jgi:hypothetical protein
MSRRKKKKQLNQIIEEYVISSKIENYFQLPNKMEEAIDTDRDYYTITMRSTLLLSKDEKIVKGIQKRLMLAIRNSIVCHRFASFDSNDTFVSVNSLDGIAYSNLFNLKSLENAIGKTTYKAVRIFSGRMNSGFYSFAARMDEKQARIYMHKDTPEHNMFYYLGPFIESESDRDWLLIKIVDKIELAKQVHF